MNFRSGLVTILISLISFNAFSQSVSRIETDSTKVQTKREPLPITANYLGMFYGPVVTEPGNHAIPDTTIGASSGTYVRSNLSLDYIFNPQWSVGAVADFDYNLTDPNSGGASVGYAARDYYIAGRHTNAYTERFGGGHVFNLNADTRYYAPTSRSSWRKHSLGAVRLTLDPSIQFANSRWSFSTRLYSKHFIQTRSRSETGDLLNIAELYVSPQLNYNFSDKISAFFLAEAVTLVKADLSIGDPTQHLVDVQPGMNFQLGKSFVLTPYLSWFTELPVKTTTANLNAAVTLF
ncbi:MAG: hypothetical protein AB7F43_13225 [Bacteriovoracia bacterium]